MLPFTATKSIRISVAGLNSAFSKGISTTASYPFSTAFASFLLTDTFLISPFTDKYTVNISFASSLASSMIALTLIPFSFHTGIAVTFVFESPNSTLFPVTNPSFTDWIISMFLISTRTMNFLIRLYLKPQVLVQTTHCTTFLPTVKVCQQYRKTFGRN